MDKRLERQIIAAIKSKLGPDYANREIHSDDIDTAAYEVAEQFRLDEDLVRYLSDLPR